MQVEESEEELMFMGLNMYRADYIMCGVEYSVRVGASSKFQAPFRAGLILGNCLANIDDVQILRIVLEAENI